MYTVTVRDSVMIAHSLDHPAFGSAQRLHGATYVVDVEFGSSTLTGQNVVIDMREARRVLAQVLGALAYRNLDEMSEFRGKLTTAEFMARYIHDEIRSALEGIFSGRIRVRLGETHDASAGFEG